MNAKTPSPAHRRVATRLACTLLLAAGPACATPTATLRVVDDFAESPYAGRPNTELVQANDGLWYGADGGGPKENGAIYSTDLHGHAQTVHNFTYKEGDIINGALVQAPDGKLYGTAFSGGTTTYGTVFSLTLDGTPTILHTFTGPDGDNPESGLLLAADGSFYGTTVTGGKQGQGVIFRIDATGNFAVVHEFGVAADDGENPEGQLVQASDGAIFGTTLGGGGGHGGTVFRLSGAGNVDTVVAFEGRKGTGPSSPLAGLVDGLDGWFYGTSLGGGAGGMGTIYRVKADSQLQVLHEFAGDATEGHYAQARLCRASDGRFYGVNRQGGAANLGTAYRIDAAGKFLLLHSFVPADGSSPLSALVETAPGNFLGALPWDGPADRGTTYLLKVH